jgi:hypothetical protein
MELVMYPTLALLNAAFETSGAPAANDAGSGDSSFDYRTELKPAGIIAIDGRRIDDGSAFSLRLAHSGKVTGKVAGSDVSFWVSAAAHRRLFSRLAA